MISLIDSQSVKNLRDSLVKLSTIQDLEEKGETRRVDKVIIDPFEDILVPKI